MMMMIMVDVQLFSFFFALATGFNGWPKFCFQVAAEAAASAAKENTHITRRLKIHSQHAVQAYNFKNIPKVKKTFATLYILSEREREREKERKSGTRNGNTCESTFALSMHAYIYAHPCIISGYTCTRGMRVTRNRGESRLFVIKVKIHDKILSARNSNYYDVCEEKFRK